MPRGRGSGRRGPIGSLASLVGQGVGLASEYREHRRVQQEARSASQQDMHHTTSQETPPTFQNQARPTPGDAPPAYADVAAESEVTIQSSQQPSRDTKGEPELWEDDTSDSDIDNLSLTSLEDDSEDWELDEAVPTPSETASLPSYEQSEAMKEGETVDELVQEVMAESRPDPSGEKQLERRGIPCPVIIPQRRPRTKMRGFVRAYSPVLEDCGIDEQTFLKFLENFYKASKASPIFPAIEIAAGLAGFVPSVVAMAVTTAVQVAAAAGKEVQTRSRTNNFLDRMNEELFKPAGLYAMIIKYKSDAEMQEAAGRSGPLSSMANMIRPEKVDVSTNQSIAKYSRMTDSGDRSMSDRMANLRLASGTTKGTIELPEAAPLIFPDIDHKLKHDGPETFKDKTKDAGTFLADYRDRRAQMKYATQDPNSSLAMPSREMHAAKSPYADPNHPMYSGGLVSLVSGGKIDPHEARRERRRERALYKDLRRIERGKSPRRQDKRARRYGDDYAGNLDARVADRRERVQMMVDARVGRGGRRGRRSHHDRGGDGEERYSARRGFESGYDGAERGDFGEGSSRGASRGGYDSGRGRGGRGRGRRDGRERNGGPISSVRRLMREDVLYLMIVNMPSEMELEEARQEMARAKGST